jgi:methylenetetrahydrofolate--tRNA-(uracil-5-)-methyltransferase
VLSAAGLQVRLWEMRPRVQTPAHQTGDLAELVCSNSLGSTDPSTGKGLLLQELRALGSLIVSAATEHRVPAGTSLAVDRNGFAQAVTGRIESDPNIELVREELTEVEEGPTLIATGPLTSEALSQVIAGWTGQEHLYFYDAISPIVTAESLDHEKVYAASRWGKGSPDFLNCPFTQEEYDRFLDALLSAERVESKDFEKELFFERCMPIEAMAERGRKTLSFGPMRPVGLEDPRTGKRPYAVLQLRKEDQHGQLYNLVGFQTKLKYGEQKRVFGLIPGLEKAEYVRLGSVHRNTFINTPTLLTEQLSMKSRPVVWFAGQIMGAEGYAENTASGLMAALFLQASVQGRTLAPPPETTAIGALLAYLRTADPRRFQPMNFNFGLLPPLETRVRNKKARRQALVERAQQDWARWIEEQGLSWLQKQGADVGVEPGHSAVS